MATTYRKCVVAACDNNSAKPGSGRGFCGKHYSRLRNHGDPLGGGPPKPRGGTTCKVDGCDVRSTSRGFCPKHLWRFKKHGNPLIGEHRNVGLDWIREHSACDLDTCLAWPFSVSGHGRGKVNWDGRPMSAPRAMCILAHGEPPSPTYHAAHSCGKGHEGCVNPQHLSWKTPAENEADKIDHGTLRKGAAINTAKLTEDDVRAIRRHPVYRGSGAALARKYGISTAAVSSILKRKSWAWLTDEAA